MGATPKIDPGAPPTDLVRGERLLWKMADVKGVFSKRLVTGYLITNYRCFVWDAEEDVVRASAPISRCEVEVSNHRFGLRSRRGGRFLPVEPPPPPGPEQAGASDPPPEEKGTIGDLSFKVDGQVVMVFREVNDPQKVKELVDGLRARGRPSSDGRLETVLISKRTG